MTAVLSLEETETCSVIRFDDGKANVFNPNSVGELEGLLARVESSSRQALVIAGRPGFFSAGLDLKLLPTLERESLHAFVRRYCAAMARLSLFPKPVVAACTGHTMAGGMVMALACDFRVGARGDYKVGLNETQIGVTLPSVVLRIAGAVLSPATHTEVMLHGRIYTPEQAHAVGLFDTLAAPADVLDEAKERAARLARVSGISYARTKRRMRQRDIAPALADLDLELAESFLPNGQ